MANKLYKANKPSYVYSEGGLYNKLETKLLVYPISHCEAEINFQNKVSCF